MKKILFSLLALCILGTSAAQTAKCGIDTKALVREQVSAGATTIGFLAKMQPNFDRDRLLKADITIGAQFGQIVTLRVPVDRLSELETNREVLQYSIAHRVGGPLMDNTRSDTRTNKVQAGDGVSNNTGYNGGYNQGYAQPQQAAPAPMAPAQPDVNASVYDEDIPF